MRNFPRVWSPRTAAATLAIILAICGAAALIVGYTTGQDPPPRPAAAAAGRVEPRAKPIAPSTRHKKAVPATTSTTVALAASPPVELNIPSIGVRSSIVELGQNADGSVEVPTSFHVAGWYKYGVTPGQDGPSVFFGHVDSVSGPGIFYRLGDLRPGDHVLVRRNDGRSVTYVITGVRQYSKIEFPTIDVYANTAVPTIRLVTCGGVFDAATHHYLSNVVAFGQLS